MLINRFVHMRKDEHSSDKIRLLKVVYPLITDELVTRRDRRDIFHVVAKVTRLLEFWEGNRMKLLTWFSVAGMLLLFQPSWSEFLPFLLV